MVEELLFIVLHKKQPVYEEELKVEVFEDVLNDTSISSLDLQEYLSLKLREGINYDYTMLKLADSGNAYANFEIGSNEYYGFFAGYPRYNIALEYLEKAASMDHASANYMIGNMFISGNLGSMSNSDLELGYSYIEKSYKLGLAKKDRYDLMISKRETISNFIEFTRNYSVRQDMINDFLVSVGSTPARQTMRLFDFLLRPQLTINNLLDVIPELRRQTDYIEESRREEILEAAEILIKYSGYIDRERMVADKLQRLDYINISDKFDYSTIQSLSTEARQKLNKIRPQTIGQASRIPGISPNDINVLLVMLGR